MDASEAQVKCLELAMAQARNEGNHQDIERVAHIQKKFYALVAGEPTTESETKPEKVNRKPKVDKAPEIFK